MGPTTLAEPVEAHLLGRIKATSVVLTVRYVRIYIHMLTSDISIAFEQRPTH